MPKSSQKAGFAIRAIECKCSLIDLTRVHAKRELHTSRAKRICAVEHSAHVRLALVIRHLQERAARAGAWHAQIIAVEDVDLAR